MPTTRQNLLRAPSLIFATSFASCSPLRNAVTGTASLVSLSIITAKPIPQFGWQPQDNWPQSRLRAVDQIRPIGEGTHERDREPVARGLAQPDLVLHVMRQVRQRVALGRDGVRR